MLTAPSRYNYPSDREFEAAMAEWTAENEPTYRVTYWAGESWQTRDFPYLADAKDFYKERRHDDYLRQDCRRAVLERHFPSPVGHLPSRYFAPGDGPVQVSNNTHIDHLPGGSRADYRMAGFRRY